MRRCYLVILALALVTSPALALLPTKEELNRTHAWAQAKFANGVSTQPNRGDMPGLPGGGDELSRQPPFSFVYGGKTFAE